MAVKMASVVITHLGWEEGEKVLEMHYLSHGAELRFGLSFSCFGWGFFFSFAFSVFILLQIISQLIISYCNILLH